MSELKQLTRKSLEHAYSAMEKRSMAETLKTNVLRDRIRSITVVVANECSGRVKQEINGRLRALVSWIDGNSQFQFQEEIKEMESKRLYGYDNFYWLLGGMIGGITSGLLTAWNLRDIL